MGKSGGDCDVSIKKGGDWKYMSDQDIFEFFDNYCSKDYSTPMSFNQLYDFCKDKFLSAKINEHADDYIKDKFPFTISDAYGLLMLDANKLRGAPGVTEEDIEGMMTPQKCLDLNYNTAEENSK